MLLAICIWQLADLLIKVLGVDLSCKGLWSNSYHHSS